MRQAHTPIVELATATLAGVAGNVLDLGSGNGALLKRIVQANPSLEPFGIDIDPIRVEHARQVLPEFADNMVVGDIFDSEPLWRDGRRYVLGILMPGRLMEVDAEQAARLRARLRDRCDGVLVYAYEDYLAQFGSLNELLRRSGISIIRASSSGTVAVGRLD
jgi:SAM-dependent methyltransferase